MALCTSETQYYVKTDYATTTASFQSKVEIINLLMTYRSLHLKDIAIGNLKTTTFYFSLLKLSKKKMDASHEIANLGISTIYTI